MKVTPALKKEVANWLDTYWTTYLKGDIETWATFIRDDYRNIGGTREEIWNSKQEIIDYTNSILSQMVGTVDIRNRKVELIPYGEYMMVNEFTDLYVKIEGEWTFYGPFRMSSLLEKTDTGWIALHQHGSYPDMKAMEGEAFSIDALKAENAKLQAAVKKRTIELEQNNRELEIEAATERVRVQSMAMQQPKDLGKVNKELLHQLTKLEIPGLSGVSFYFIDPDEIVTVWDLSSPGNMNDPNSYSFRFDSKKHPVMGEFVGILKSTQDDYFILDYPKDKLLQAIEELKDIDIKIAHNFKHAVESGALLHQWNPAARITDGILSIDLMMPPTDDTKAIVLKMAGAFNQAYQRFLDLQKAEAQAKEAEIQLALERVRARSMAMHKSEELADLSLELVKQVQALGVATWFCAFNINDEDPKGSLEWGSNGQGTFPQYRTPREGVFLRYYEAGQRGETLLINEIGEKECPAHYEYLCSLPGVGEQLLQMKAAGIPFPVSQIDHVAFFKYGYLLFITYEPVPEAHDIFIRFAKVFEQTYTRFLDLQKAEAQAREAEIELALERVRNRAMAMHSSQELKDVATELRNQMSTLGQTDMEICAIHLYDESLDYFESIAAGPVFDPILKVSQIQVQVKLPKRGIQIIEEMMNQYYSGKKDYVLVNHGAKGVEWFELLKEKVPLAYELVVQNLKGTPLEELIYYWSVSDFKGGSLVMTTYVPPGDESRKILRRFANVFGLAYQRFKDLQKAEAQAREAQVEAALERVRSRTMAMQKSEDLNKAASDMFNQIQVLGMQPWACGFNIFDKDEKTVTQYMSLADGGISPPFRTPLTEDPFFINIYDARHRSDELLVMESKGESLAETYRYMFSLPGSGEIFGDLENSGFEMPKFQMTYCAYFSQGYLVFITYEPVPEAHDIFKRFAKVFEQTYTRFLDLQKAEAQAREAQIEAALERVRSRSMAMHKSDELLEVINVVSEQLQQLNIRFGFVCFGVTTADGSLDFWMASPGFVNPERIHMPFVNNPINGTLIEAQKKGVRFSTNTFTAGVMREWMEVMFDSNPASQIMTQSKSLILDSPGLARTSVLMNDINVFIGNFAMKPFTDEQNAIFIRFANVFEQSYTRFLDLQKAESQAREAQIETALERVRSKTMAMHNSTDVGETAAVMVDELKRLGIETIRCGIGIMHEPGDMEVWTIRTNENDKSDIIIGWLDMNLHPLLHGAFESWRKKNESYSYDLKNDDLLNYYNAINNYPGYPIHYDTSSLPKQIHHNEFYFPEGILFSFSLEQLSPDQRKVFKRFAGVFGQTYRRYLDLQKAEAQAKEAQIETALEKVRSRTMAMQRSDELGEVATVLFKQMNQLVDNLWSCGFVLCEKDRGEDEWWLSTESGFIPTFFLPNTGDRIHENLYRGWKSGETFRAEQVEGAELEQHYEWLMSIPVSKKIFDDMAAAGFQKPVWQKLHGAYFSKGYLVIITQVPCQEEEIFKRFAQVFDLTYTRFLDLQKAEAQAKESQIEAALERVRSRTLAMQKSDELAETAAVLFQQLIALGIAPNRLYIAIIKGEMGETEFWITDEDGSKVSTAFAANMNDNISFYKMYEGWKQQKKSLVIDMEGEELKTYLDHLSDLGVPFKGGLTQKRRVQDIAYFSKGFIGIASPDDQPAETLVLLERFAAVFNLTFTRFNDLKIAEAHAEQAELDLIKLKEEKQRTEKALAELQVTQKQLVQSEKMASLGELTAGIAHEIQNPLNFVNNFSDINRELLAEMKDEMDKGNITDAKEIANDVIGNEEKINHHGKRADAIVKGMLQHSRASSSQKEPTDINKLADEYLRLAYHGLRAKDKSFNATLKTEYDETIGNINIIPQDIGRVILNLITNAFYVVDEKRKQQPVGYEPVVLVSTKKMNGKVEIKVKDNGNGIPKKIVDKIFQPFFTTKPAGQGTGLGLSLSYDILRTHGGEIDVSTKEGEGTEFIIQLPCK